MVHELQLPAGTSPGRLSQPSAQALADVAPGTRRRGAAAKWRLLLAAVELAGVRGSRAQTAGGGGDGAGVGAATGDRGEAAGRRHVRSAWPWARAVRGGWGRAYRGGSGVLVLCAPPGSGWVIPCSGFAVLHNFAGAQVRDSLSQGRIPRAAPAPV